MNYYEELGLTQRASNEEIHEAYRNLARLLHPDQHQDERLRRLAESQMKRLNEVHSVLADPAQRRRYDAGLGALEIPAGAGPRQRKGPGLWLLPPAIAALSILAYVAIPAARWEGDAPRPAGSLEARLTASPAPAVTAGRRGVARPIRSFRRTAESSAGRVEPEVAEPLPPELAPQAPLPASLPPVNLAPSVAPPARASEPPRSALAGVWVYVPSRTSPQAPGLYPPEFIEAAIIEDGGVLHGRYWARYRIADRPISPEVAFRFEGRAGQDEASLAWAGPGGAKGEAELKLVSPNALEMKWIATELGTQMGLASGTAVLVKRK